MKRTKREPDFSTEAELCAAFSDWAARQGFTVYAETDGWDIVCVTEDGLQLGVEAKLRMNVKVISQAMRGTNSVWRELRGPDYRAILVPEDAIFAADLLAHAGISVFTPTYKDSGGWRFERIDTCAFEMHDWNPSKRLVLPDFVPDVPAGVPGPKKLSPWKVGALRVLALIELQGYVTRDQVRECRNDPRRWCAADGWLTPAGGGRWAAGRAPRFDQQHPTVYAQVLAETRERMAAKTDLLGAAA